MDFGLFSSKKALDFGLLGYCTFVYIKVYGWILVYSSTALDFGLHFNEVLDFGLFTNFIKLLYWTLVDLNSGLRSTEVLQGPIVTRHVLIS